jgi:hypothetical protein
MFFNRILFSYNMKDIHAKFEGSNPSGRLPTLQMKIGQICQKQAKIVKNCNSYTMIFY